MALHPTILADLTAAAGKAPYYLLPLPEARAQVKQAYLGKLPPVAVASVRELAVPGPAGPIPVRVYTPFERGPRPLVVFFHGSGFTVLDLDSHDDICRHICRQSGCVVASVDYRLAPEHRFPAAPDDCLAATRWLADHAQVLGCAPGPIALAGDSAGACLAAVTALRLRDEGGPVLGALLMWYPVTDHPSTGWPSYAAFGQGYGLSAEGMAWFWAQYLGDAREAAHPHASPLRAGDLGGLPPTWLMTAEYDVLRDEGDAFGRRLREAGVAVLLDRGRGMNHGFLKYIGVLDEATRAIAQATAWLRHTLVAGPCGAATHPGRSAARHSAGAPQRSHGRKPEETQ